MVAIIHFGSRKQGKILEQLYVKIFQLYCSRKGVGLKLVLFNAL